MKCKSPLRFQKYIILQVKTFILPCCYIKNGNLQHKRLIKRRNTLRKVEAYIREAITFLDTLIKQCEVNKK